MIPHQLSRASQTPGVRTLNQRSYTRYYTILVASPSRYFSTSSEPNAHYLDTLLSATPQATVHASRVLVILFRDFDIRLHGLELRLSSQYVLRTHDLNSIIISRGIERLEIVILRLLTHLA